MDRHIRSRPRPSAARPPRPPLATSSHDTIGTVSFQSLTFRGEIFDPLMPSLIDSGR
jgi:hypothetical protein